MKKCFTLIAVLFLAAVSAWGQGTVFFYAGASRFTRISTNSAVGGAATGTTLGNATYCYALFYSTTATDVNGQSTAISGNNANYVFNDSRWTLVGYGTNSGSLGQCIAMATNAEGSLVVPGVAGGSYVNFVALGWSANIGTNIAAVQNWYNTGGYFTGWIGQSAVGVNLILGGYTSSPPYDDYPAPEVFAPLQPGFPGFLLGVIPSDYLPPAMISQPTNQVVNAGGVCSFTAMADGDSALVLGGRWMLNGTYINNGGNYTITSTNYIDSTYGYSKKGIVTLTISNAQLANAGNYSIVVTSQAGSVTSSNALLSVSGAPPMITSQPADVSALVGSNASFTVSANGTPPLLYQWSFNGTNLANATNATLSLTGVQLTDAGNYSVGITNASGSTNSRAALLSVGLGAPPMIASQPMDAAALVGGNISFTVSVNGTPPLYYQWSLNGTNLASATNSTLTLMGVQLTNAGNYSVTITNNAGTTNSRAALLSVTAVPPFITGQPANQTVPVGDSAGALFSVAAGGSPPLNYQWSFNGAGLPGATSPALAIHNVSTNNTGSYSVAITNAYGSTNSITVTLTVIPPCGYVFFAAGQSASTKLMTNSSVGGPATGLTATNVGLYYYALYASASATNANGGTNAIVGNTGGPYVWADPAWSLVGYGVNYNLSGTSIALSTDANGQVPVLGIPGGTQAHFVVIGWSAKVGSDITNVQSWYNGGSPANDGWIGQSTVGGALWLGDGGVNGTYNVFGIGNGRVKGFTLGLVSAVPNAHYNPATGPAPVLTTVKVGNSIQLSWSATYTNYGVQSAGTFFGDWENVAATPVVEGTNLTVTLPITNPAPYFRLIVQ